MYSTVCSKRSPICTLEMLDVLCFAAATFGPICLSLDLELAVRSVSQQRPFLSETTFNQVNYQTLFESKEFHARKL